MFLFVNRKSTTANHRHAACTRCGKGIDFLGPSFFQFIIYRETPLVKCQKSEISEHAQKLKVFDTLVEKRYFNQ